jgi:chromosome segregation ATPase
MQLLYEKQLQDKIEELTQQFEQVIRMREQEKEQLLAEAAARQEEHQRQLTALNATIAQLTSNVANLSRELGSAKQELKELAASADDLRHREQVLTEALQAAEARHKLLEADLQERQQLVQQLRAEQAQLQEQIADLDRKSKAEAQRLQMQLE